VRAACCAAVCSGVVAVGGVGHVVAALESGGRSVVGVAVAVLTGTALNSEAPGAV
jgi:hypothetical protein